MSDKEEAPEAGQGSDLRSVISAAYDQVEAAEAAPTEATEEAPEKSGPARDEHGRFAAKEKETDLETEATTEAEESVQSPIPLPTSWSAEQEAWFRTLPREAQEYLGNRETERERSLGRSSQQAARYEKVWANVERELKPHIQTLERSGLPLEKALSGLLATQAALDTNPAQAIRQLCHDYQINPAQLVNTQQGTQQQQSAAPTYDRQLLARLDRLETERKAEKDAEQSRALSALENEVGVFAEEKGSDGQPLRPHFERLADDIAAFTASLKARYPDESPQRILDRAYRAALALDPEALAQESKRQELARITEAKAKAEKAKRAGASVTASTPGGNGMAKGNPKTVREAIEAAWAQHNP